MPHAILLSGPQGTGKFHFAQYLTASLLCFAPNDDLAACGQCKSCNLYFSGNHPDLNLIEPEETGKQIKVNQIRKLIEFINLKSQYGHHKVVIINPADAMNRSAANTLLKTLEEPPEQSVLILIGHRSNLLPITVKSRCQAIQFQPVYDTSAINWLEDQIDSHAIEQLLYMASGAPLAALSMAQNGDIDLMIKIVNDLDLLQSRKDDPIQIADKWNKAGALRIFQWLLKILCDLARLKSDTEYIKHIEADLQPCLQRLTNRLDLYRLIQCYDLLLKNYSMCMGQISYNTQALLEEFIIYWQEQSNCSGGNIK